MNIEKELELLIEQKRGNNDLALFYIEGCDTPWRLALGNSSPVMLGETEGDLQVDGESIEDCINQMSDLLSVEKMRKLGLTSTGE